MRAEVSRNGFAVAAVIIVVGHGCDSSGEYSNRGVSPHEVFRYVWLAGKVLLGTSNLLD